MERRALLSLAACFLAISLGACGKSATDSGSSDSGGDYTQTSEAPGQVTADRIVGQAITIEGVKYHCMYLIEETTPPVCFEQAASSAR